MQAAVGNVYLLRCVSGAVCVRVAAAERLKQWEHSVFLMKESHESGFLSCK